MSMSIRQKFVLLSIAVATVGFILGRGVAGLYTDIVERPYRFTGYEDVRREPTLLAPLVYNYYAGGEGRVLDKLEMERPTAGKMKVSRVVELSGGGKCFLGQGDVYRISSEQAEQGKCFLEVRNAEDELFKVAVQRADIRPLDEGVWLLVRNERGKDGWIRANSKWE